MGRLAKPYTASHGDLKGPRKSVRGMSDLLIVLGNKNYSSWSLRPWLALKATGQPFREEIIWLYKPGSKERILQHSPAGKVPVLKDGALVVWESLAICEYLAERFPTAKLWPDDRAARAVARSVATEMHGGFAGLRRDLSMDIRARIADRVPAADAQADIARIIEIWRDCRSRYGAGGPMLFGRFSIADCMYAPVVTRFVTYGVALDPVCSAYRDAVMALPAMQEWIAAARAEAEVIPA